jgi:parallel beta-helix repeat protein
VEISGFTVTNSTGWLKAGICLNVADHCTISNNICSNNDIGIHLWNSSSNTITGNTVSNNCDGLSLEWDSNNNTIIDNGISNNSYYGIDLWNSNSNTINSNIFESDSLFVSFSFHNTVENNIINGKPLVYLEDVLDYKVRDAGQVILIKCTNITVESLDLFSTSVGMELWETVDSIIADNTLSSNSCYGLYLWDSSSNTITGNTVSNNDDGISLTYSSSNTITGNTVSNNSYYGISLEWDSNSNTITGNTVSNNDDGIFIRDPSSNNKIYLNNFINNIENVHPETSGNIWNATEQITYTFNGTTYTDYLGNYWDDYEVKYPDAEEIDATGIWNTPYDIDGDSDNSPLMEPFENYKIEEYKR